MATKALSYTGWLQHNGTFICYAWPQRPSATQADYSITALLFVMHGHTGWLQHNCIVKNDLKDVSFFSLRLSFRATDNGGTTPSCSYFQTKKCLFCSIDSQWILERVMIFQGCPIKGKLTTVNHHGWSNLLHLFRPWFFPFIATHWILRWLDTVF